MCLNGKVESPPPRRRSLTVWRQPEGTFTTLSVPTNQEEGEHVETELATNFSTLYHVNSRLQLLLEFDSESVLSDEEFGEQTWRLTPGARAPLFSLLTMNIFATVSKRGDASC